MRWLMAHLMSAAIDFYFCLTVHRGVASCAPVRSPIIASNLRHLFRRLNQTGNSEARGLFQQNLQYFRHCINCFLNLKSDRPLPLIMTKLQLKWTARNRGMVNIPPVGS